MKNSSFSFQIVPEIIFGEGVISKLGTIAKRFGKRVLLVVDPAIIKSGLLEPINSSLNESDLCYFTFSDITPEPWVETADKAAEIAITENCKAVIGVGGGSAMDVAKAASVLATNAGKASDYQGLDLVREKGLPKIIVPTTAGTGSEVTFTSVLSRKEPKMKAGINSSYLFPEVALLDPELTLTVPPEVTASTGMDALTHAIEAYTSLQATPISELISREAIRLIGKSLRRATHDGKNLEARRDMLMGSLLAGISLANAGVGAVHALAYPLGGNFRVPHGVSNGLLLPYVMRFNSESCMGKYADIAVILGEYSERTEVARLCENALSLVMNLAVDVNVPRKLSELNIKEKHLPEMAESAMEVKRPLENNPRNLTKEDAISIYRQAL